MQTPHRDTNLFQTALVRTTWLARLRTLPLALPLALLAGLLLRVLLWGQIPRTQLISDEGEYLSAATWMAQGRGLSWYQNYLWTRAPLYPAFLAMHLRLFGQTLLPIMITQTVLSLVNVGLVFVLARHLAAELLPDQRRPIAAIAAVLMALYFPFAVYTQVLLSETVYLTLLLGGCVLLAFWMRNQAVARSRRSLIAAGMLFGLATLTRSLTLPFVPIVALWIWSSAAARPR